MVVRVAPKVAPSWPVCAAGSVHSTRIRHDALPDPPMFVDRPPQQLDHVPHDAAIGHPAGDGEAQALDGQGPVGDVLL
jgi:hypothetical protein